jgi:hypothetical protein
MMLVAVIVVVVVVVVVLMLNWMLVVGNILVKMKR